MLATWLVRFSALSLFVRPVQFVTGRSLRRRTIPVHGRTQGRQERTFWILGRCRCVHGTLVLDAVHRNYRRRAEDIVHSGTRNYLWDTHFSVAPSNVITTATGLGEDKTVSLSEFKRPQASRAEPRLTVRDSAGRTWCPRPWGNQNAVYLAPSTPASDAGAGVNSPVCWCRPPTGANSVRHS